VAQRKAKRRAPPKSSSAAKSRSNAPSSDLVDLTIVDQSKLRISKKFLVSWVNRVAFELQLLSSKDKRLKNLNWSGAVLTIAFLPEAQARELNKMYRGKDYATDILSFADLSAGVLGELAICPAVVERQAPEHGLSFEEELGYMILHGLLHLLGFDHEGSAGEAKKMFSVQDSVFEKLRSEI
jgi:probable rRNA maturation factor